MPSPLELAEAFSGHRFADTYDHLADDVRWNLPGHDPIVGKDAVVAACRQSQEQMDSLADTSFSRFVSVAGPSVAAVDAVGHYASADGSTSVVSSADIYELDAEGRITAITSYAVEIG